MNIESPSILHWKSAKKSKVRVVLGTNFGPRLGKHPILAKKGTFHEKRGTKNFTSPYSIPFLSVLHQNKTVHNVLKMGQRLTAVGIKDLDRSVVRSHNVKKKKKKRFQMLRMRNTFKSIKFWL